MNRDIDNSQDILDSRDIIARIEELEEYRNDLFEEKGWTVGEIQPTENGDWLEWVHSEECTELSLLLDLQDELEGYCDDWRYGVTLIRDSYWPDYAEELCKDLGYLQNDLPDFIKDNIDWEKVAEDLQVDYTSADFDGVTYWAR